jgi:cytochrome c553
MRAWRRAAAMVTLIGAAGAAAGQGEEAAAPASERSLREVAAEPAGVSAAEGAASTDPAPAAGEAEAVDAARLYAARCAQYHGRQARGAGSYPRLAGRDADDLSGKLAAYRDGTRF